MLCMPCEISSGHFVYSLNASTPRHLMLSGPDIGQVHEEYHVFHRSVPQAVQNGIRNGWSWQVAVINGI